MELIEITYRDKTTNKISVFNSSNTNNIICICLPAMGVRASYYKIFAEELAQSCYAVITADWRGQGVIHRKPLHSKPILVMSIT